MVEEKNEEEKGVSEERINEKLNQIIDSESDHPTIKLLAKLVFNLRFDLNELKQELIKALGVGDGVDNPDYEELQYPKDNRSDWNVPKRFQREIYS